MNLATIIDLFLIPIAGGIGGILGLSMAVRKQPEKYRAFSSLAIRLGFGAVIAGTLFVVKMQ